MEKEGCLDFFLSYNFIFDGTIQSSEIPIHPNVKVELSLTSPPKCSLKFSQHKVSFILLTIF